MDGLVSLFIFALFFYFMMRFGCGAHMVHGKHEHEKSEDSTDSVHKDPVCGREVSTSVGYGKMYKEQLYRFCSKKCLDQFDENPDQFEIAQENSI